MSSEPAKQEKKPLKWAKWISKRPGVFFGVGLAVHMMFVVISGVLYVTGYDILPIVFDDIPLSNLDEPMYRRNTAWQNRDENLEDAVIAREKRDIHEASMYGNDEFTVKIKMGKEPIEHDKLQDDVLAAVHQFSLGGNDGFFQQSDDSEDNWLLSTDPCCMPSQSVKPFSGRHCVCNPNSKDHSHRRSKRDIIDAEDPHERKLLLTSLSFIYETEDDNIFTKEHLKQIAEFEYSLYNRKDFQTKYCRLTQIFGLLHCQNLLSVLRFFDGSYSFDNDDLFDPSLTDIPSVLSAAYESDDTVDLFKYFLSKDAVVNISNKTIVSKMTRSLMNFGWPLAGHTDDERSKQKNIWVKWTDEVIVPIGLKYFEEGLGDLNFFFFGQDLYWREAFKQVFVDWYLLIGAFGFIFLFMWFQTGSLFITSFGLLSIITSFVGANLIYCVIIGYKFFGIFNVLAIFIILGIGADDIFIYSDTWKMNQRGNYGGLEERLSITFKRAVVAMFVTSLTTMVAFFVNSFSPLLPVSAFGSFAGLTVFVNYISVITFFPGVVQLYNEYFKNKACLCCGKHNHKDSTSCPDNTKTNTDTENPTEKTETTSQNDKEVHTTNTFSDRINKLVCDYLGGLHFRAVTHRVGRWIILAIFGAVLAGAVYLVTTIQPASREFQLFSDGHFYEIANKHRTTSFMSNIDEATVDITVVWGLQLQDMSDCSRLVYSELTDCTGTTIWDDKFDLSDGESQLALLNLCKELKAVTTEDNDLLKIGDDEETGEKDVVCFIEDMAEFYKTEGSESFYPPGTSLAFPITQEKVQILTKSHPDIYKNDSHNLIQRHFEVALNFWLTNRYTNETVPARTRAFRSSLGQVDVNEYNLASPSNKATPRFRGDNLEIYETRLRYAGIDIYTSIPTRSTSLQDGLGYLANWETYINEKMKSLPESLSGGFQCTRLWSWLRILESLAIQSISACGIGIALSFLVIFLGTTNIITGLWTAFLLVSVTICVIAVIPLAGWQFGLLEALNLCLIVGLAVDYIVHFAEAFHMSIHKDRLGRVQESLEKVGISVLSGAITTMGASFFMLFAKIVFFKQFGIFIFSTIGFSLVFTLFVFVAGYSIFGPEGYTGSFMKLCKDRNKYKVHDDELASRTTSGTFDDELTSTTSGTSNPTFDDERSSSATSKEPCEDEGLSDTHGTNNPAFVDETTEM